MITQVDWKPTMSPLYVFCTIVLAFSYHGEVSSFGVGEIKTYLKNKVESLKSEVLLADFGLQELTDSLLEDGQQHLKDAVRKGKEDLAALKGVVSDVCLAEAGTKLDNIHESAFSDFIHCTELVNIIYNSKEIGNSTLALIEDLMKGSRALINGLDNCFPALEEKGLKCINDFVWKIVDTIKGFITDCFNYQKEIKERSTEIREEVSTCLHPNATAPVAVRVQDVLLDLKGCTKH